MSKMCATDGEGKNINNNNKKPSLPRDFFARIYENNDANSSIEKKVINKIEEDEEDDEEEEEDDNEDEDDEEVNVTCIDDDEETNVVGKKLPLMQQLLLQKPTLTSNSRFNYDDCYPLNTTSYWNPLQLAHHFNTSGQQTARMKQHLQGFADYRELNFLFF